MINNSIIFIRLDTHKALTQLAVLKDERGDKTDSLKKINNKSAFIKLARKLQPNSPKAILHFIYEAMLWLLDLPTTNQTWSLLLYRCPLFNLKK